MKRVCAWCGVTLQEGEPPISHGMCAVCEEKFGEESLDLDGEDNDGRT